MRASDTIETVKMINRVLIRIKVIQILYSFLLVEKQFTLESNPSAPTKEKRFAYALYLDFLVLIVKISRRVERRKGEYPLAETWFVSRILIDDILKSRLQKYDLDPFPFERLVGPLAESVEESGVYRNYLRDLDKGIAAADENVWRELLRLVIFPDTRLTSAIEEREMYTLKGMERAQDMLLRTLVNFLASQDNVDEVVESLEESLDQARELYFRLLLLVVELTQMQDRVLDDNRHKFLATDEDRNPNMRFVDNRVAHAIAEDPRVQAFLKESKRKYKQEICWLRDQPLLMHKLLKSITSSEIYREYMEAPECTRTDDGELWRDLMKKVILENEDFLETLEEMSVFWNDDLEIMSTFVLKTLRRYENEDCEDAIMNKYKDAEDEAFGQQLMRAVYKNKETYRRYIDEVLTNGNWDAERLAFMDVVILETALAEIMNFPKIPLTVSINEYIEIAKSYSTARSGSFVNGILGAVTNKLRSERILLGK